MKTQLRLAPHSQLRGENVIEVWYDGEFIAEVVGADAPGVRVISKYKKTAVPFEPLILEVRIER